MTLADRKIKEQRDRRDVARRVPVVAVACLTLVLAVLFLVLPKRDFSGNENRMLARMPAFSAKGALDGTFQTGFEDYLADQFPFRDRFYAFSVRTERLLGKREVGGVFLCGDRLIDVYEAPRNTEKFLAAVNRLADHLDRAQVTLLLAPTAVTVCADELPAFAEARMSVKQTDTMRQIADGVQGCFVESAQVSLEEGRDAGEEMFYRTDHHWTTKGAYRAYRQLAPALGFVAAEIPAEAFSVVSDTFYGTSWSKVCDPSIPPDAIELYENPAWAGTIAVSYPDTGAVADSPYNKDYLQERDQYSLFLNNLHPLVEIENPAADGTRVGGAGNRRALAVVGDSYKNSLIPFLIDHYEKIYVFDPRYYRGGISEFVNARPEIGDVLVLYNLGTLDSDRGIGAID